MESIYTENIIFGTSLVEVYILQSKAANYPRVILDSSIIDLARKAKSEIQLAIEEMKYV